MLDKGFIAKTYKELIQLSIKNKNKETNFKKRAEKLNRHFSKEACRWPTGT